MIMHKTTSESFFIAGHQDSPLIKNCLGAKPIYGIGEVEVVVLQVMQLHDGWMLVELIKQESYSAPLK